MKVTVTVQFAPEQVGAPTVKSVPNVTEKVGVPEIPVKVRVLVVGAPPTFACPSDVGPGID